MNTPLGALRCSANTLRSAVRKLDGELDGELQHKSARLARIQGVIDETARIPEQACSRLDTILNKLSDFSRLDASEVAPVDVREAVERTLSLIPAQIKRRSVAECEFADGLKVAIAPARLNLSLMTIITNAFEANGGEGAVQLKTTRDGARVVIEVEDQGPGLSPEQAATIFEIQLDRTSSRVKAGFGLPAAQSLVKKHGGDIRVSSAAGGGACFTLTLPALGGL